MARAHEIADFQFYAGIDEGAESGLMQFVPKNMGAGKLAKRIDGTTSTSRGRMSGGRSSRRV
jgi:hypothetical protein